MLGFTIYISATDTFGTTFTVSVLLGVHLWEVKHALFVQCMWLGPQFGVHLCIHLRGCPFAEV